MNFGKLINNLNNLLSPASSPHYYHGRSVSKLFLNNLLRLVFGYLLARRPSKKLFEPLVELRDSQRGKTALILGNGPSVSLLNSEKLQEYVDDIYCVNEFYDLQISDSIACTNYVLSDPRSLIDDFGKLPSGLAKFLSCNQVRLFLPHWSEELVKGLINNDVYFFDDRERTFLNRSTSPTRPRNYASVTLYKALAIACFQGYSTIYVLGLDNTEFYSYSGSSDNSILHNGKSYGAGKSEIKPVSMSGIFVSGMAGRMQSYAHLFGDLTKFKNFNIINLHQYSLTDAFPKIAESHPLSVSG